MVRSLAGSCPSSVLFRRACTRRTIGSPSRAFSGDGFSSFAKASKRQRSAHSRLGAPEVLGISTRDGHQQLIVIPRKDSHNTRRPEEDRELAHAKRLTASSSTSTCRNVSRIRLHRQSRRAHMRMLRNALRLRNRYSLWSIATALGTTRYTFRATWRLTRTPHLLDQLGLIDFICRSTPDPMSWRSRSIPQ